MNKQLVLFTLIALLLSPLAQAEKFYKWQDENGVWHYDSKPPKTQEATALKIYSKSASPVADEADEEDEASEADKAEPRPGSDAANCKVVKANLQLLTSDAQATKDLDGDGKQDRLSREQTQAEIAATRKQIEMYCRE